MRSITIFDNYYEENNLEKKTSYNMVENRAQDYLTRFLMYQMQGIIQKKKEHSKSHVRTECYTESYIFLFLGYTYFLFSLFLIFTDKKTKNANRVKLFINSINVEDKHIKHVNKKIIK